MRREPVAQRIVLDETGPGAEVPLSSTRLATLLSHPGLVELGPGTAPGAWRVRARRRVASVRLGSGEGAVDLRIRPKVGVERLMYLLGFAGSGVDWHEDPLPVGTSDELVPAFAAVLAKTASGTLRQGILRGYVEVDEDLAVVRGRLRAGDQMRRRFGAPLPLAVTHDDFSADVAENRILLAALLLLARAPDVRREDARALRRLAAGLDGVARLAPGSDLPRWRPSRLNRHYVRVLKLAETVLAGSVPEPGAPGAGIDLDGIVVNMERVYEDFLAGALRGVLRRRALACSTRDSHHRLDTAGRVRLEPDIVVHASGGPHSVVDAKYKALGSGGPPNADLYQVVSYCTALGLAHGHLVYAGGTAARESYRVVGAPITVHVHVLDTAGTVAELRTRVERVADAVTRNGAVP
ncbi:McrC family protein [Nocardiopsis sp. NPDC050513]|uniref:McrC family protein n=1 Tax=Nocardiopsis sp. NPDC050513 TaxID=3364338 RepID=UPI0037B45CD1